jgi:hypothetical protein
LTGRLQDFVALGLAAWRGADENSRSVEGVI